MAQNYDLAEGRLHPTIDSDDWMPMVDKCRKALAEQLVTPAWDVASVTWKRTLLDRNDYVIGSYVKAERVQRAIEEDLAWLASHPTKRTDNVEACAKRRAFKEAMRQRVREIAALRNLSDEDIKPVLRLKHETIGCFCEAHGVDFGWLLEGIEPMFKAWPAS